MKNLQLFAKLSLAGIQRLIAMILIFALFCNSVFAATYKVDKNTATDTGGVCDVDIANDCSIFDAVRLANVAQPEDTITAVTGETTVTLTTTPITISSDVLIQSTATNRIVLDGAGTANISALVLDSNSDNSVIEGLVIGGFRGGFSGIGIEIQDGADNITIGGSVAARNMIGLNTAFTAANGNKKGMTSAGKVITIDNNFFSGNTLYGIKLINGAQDTLITNNTIGLDVNGADVGNGDVGVEGNGVEIVGTAISLNGDNGGQEGVTIGGRDDLYKNIISGNSGYGIKVGDGTGSVAGTLTIQGNKIGVNGDYEARANDLDGIRINSDAPTLTTLIGTNGDGTTDTSEVNNISSNLAAGVHIVEGATVTIAGNNIGMAGADPYTARGNGSTGIIIGSSTAGPDAVFVGSSNGSSDGMNAIGSNGAGGVLINNAVDIDFTGNYVGFGPGGETDRGNTGGDALKIAASLATTVDIGTGGSMMSQGFQNFFGNNTGGTNGTIAITNTAANAVTNVRNNRIGVDPIGLITAKANTQGGIYFSGLGTINIGTNSDGTQDDTEYNQIVNASGGNGIYIGGSAVTANVMGTIIGLVYDVFPTGTYTVAAGNGLSAAAGDKNGMKFDGASLATLTVGGTNTNQRNVIGANYENGISIVQLATNGIAYIYNNYIGVSSGGTTDMGNVSNGISVALTAAGPTVNIGGIASTQGNVISGNAGNGISVSGSFTHNVNIYQNIIGLVAAATSALPNDLAGISLANSLATSVIGNGASTGRNLISGNTTYGMNVTGGNVSVKGNYIGMATNGTTSLPNTVGQITATSTASSISSLTIGGSTSGQENIINNNTTKGVMIYDVTPSNNSTIDTDNLWYSRIVSLAPAIYNFLERYTSSVLTYSAPQVCYDYSDNDSDGIADLGDPGCSNSQDTDETNLGGGGGGSAASASASNSSAAAAKAEKIAEKEQAAEDKKIQEKAAEAAKAEAAEVEQVAKDEAVAIMDQAAIDQAYAVEQAAKEQEAKEQAEAEAKEKKIRDGIIAVKLRGGASLVTESVFGKNVNLDIILNLQQAGEQASEQNDPVAVRLEQLLSEKPITIEQEFIQGSLDKLAEGETLTVPEKKRVESTTQVVLEEAIGDIFKQAEASGQEAPQISVTLASGEVRQINKDAKILFRIDVARAEDEQGVFDTKGENTIVATPSTIFNDNGVAAMLAVQYGADPFDLLLEDKVFYEGLIGLRDNVTSVEELRPRVPTFNTPATEIPAQSVAWISGPKANEYVTVFAVDKVNSENPDDWKSERVGEFKLDATNKAAVEFDFRKMMGNEETKKITLVVQDKKGKGSSRETTLNNNLGMTMDTVTIQDGDQINSADLVSYDNAFAKVANRIVSLASAAVVKKDEPTTEVKVPSQITARGYADPGSVVFVTWKSVLKTSTVIADASQGYFEVQVPKGLEKGQHTAYIYSYSPQKKTASNFSKAVFNKVL